jgi:hypothetical protein
MPQSNGVKMYKASLVFSISCVIGMGQRGQKVAKTSVSDVLEIFLYLNEYFNSTDNIISEIRMTS